MHIDLGATGPNASIRGSNKIIEGVEFIDMIYFEEFRFLPVSVAIIGVKNHLFLVVVRYLHAEIYPNIIVALLRLSGFEETVHFIGLLNIPAQLLPSRNIKYIMLTIILGKVHRIITLHHGYRFSSNISIFPTIEYLIVGAINQYFDIFKIYYIPTFMLHIPLSK